MAENFLFRHLLDENAANLGFDEFKAILCDDRLHASHEEKVWEAIVKWISEDVAKRSSSLVSLMDAVRVGFIAPEYIELVFASQSQCHSIEIYAYKTAGLQSPACVIKPQGFAPFAQGE
jgi:BTB And C-terminal Kelch